MKEVEQSIVSSFNCIRNELQKSSYQIPWPPKTDDLDVQTFPEFPLLQEFLVRLINNEPSLKSDRVKRLPLSFAQDLFFADSIFSTHTQIRKKLLPCFRVGLSHFKKFKYNFQDSVDLLCNCGNSTESNVYFLHCYTTFTTQRPFL